MPHAAGGVEVAASLAEILGAFFVAAVAAGCQRSHPRPHLAPWAWSWLAGGVAMAVSTLALLIPRPPALDAPARAVTLVLRYLQVGALLAGVGAWRDEAAVSARRWRVVVWSAVGLGLASAVPLPPGPWQRAVHSWAPGATLGIALLWAGRVLGRPARETGGRLVAGALLLGGLDRLHRVGLSVSVLFGVPFPRYSLYLGFVGFALLTALGIGLVFSLLEDEHFERERAEAERRRRTEELEQEKERLRVSEEKFAKIFRSSPDSIIITVPWEKDLILDVNPGFERLTGYSAEEAVGRTTLELGLIRQEDHERLRQLASEHGMVREEEIPVRTRAGEQRIFLLSGEAIELEGRRCAVSVAWDVTEQRRAEQRLRDSEERLRLALDAAGLGAWELDLQTGVVTADAQTDALLGMPPDGLPGTLDAYLAMIHADDRPLVERAIRGAMAGPASEFGVEYRLAGGGEPRWLEGKGRVYRDPSGEPLLMRGTLAAVTARKRAEEALRESEDRWRRISEATFEGIGFSERGVMTDVNAQLAGMLGYTTQEMIGKPVWQCVAPEDRDRVAQAIRSGHTGGYQHLALRKDGSTFLVETRARELTLAGRRIRVTAVRDVSEQARLEAELRRRETLAAMGSLVAAVAHEVRTPLFSLSATLDALEAGAGTAAQQQELRDLLRSQVRRLSSLMQDLLDYGRPPKLKMVRGRIHEAVQRAARACEVQSRTSGVRIDLDLPDDLPALDADWGRLEQVFHNLIVNAVQHAPRGSAVRVGARAVVTHGAGIALTVEDSGPGVAPSDLARLFEPFFSRRKGGTGMGLAIALRLVEAHGGTLTAGNAAEGGAVFTVLLPATARPTTGGKVA
jgi:PAS domain S-box-containing protein